jgi:hypothetical protein
MREGIHLGKPKPPLRRPFVILIAATAAGALTLGLIHHRAGAEIAALTTEVAGLEASLAGTEHTASSDGDRSLAGRLRLALDVGAPDAVPLTAVLGLVDGALPENVLLESLSYGTSPTPVLQLEVSTRESGRVTELQRRLQTAALVSKTSLLEERRLSGGMLAVRVQVDLRMP